MNVILSDDTTHRTARIIGLDTKLTGTRIKEHKFRQACANALRPARNRFVKSFTVSVGDCADGNFPLVGAAKILAQEILKLARQQKAPPKIIVRVSGQRTFEVFQKTIRGYLEHLQNDLGFGPYVTVDVIIELKPGIILIERSNPPYGWALPGGFVDYGESLEEAAVREVKEETNMDLAQLRQLHTYSDPHRDPRFPTISTVFVAQGIGRPKSGDDAKGLKVVGYQDLLKWDYAFDHQRVVKDYLRSRKY